MALKRVVNAFRGLPGMLRGSEYPLKGCGQTISYS